MSLYYLYDMNSYMNLHGHLHGHLHMTRAHHLLLLRVELLLPLHNLLLKRLRCLIAHRVVGERRTLRQPRSLSDLRQHVHL